MRSTVLLLALSPLCAACQGATAGGLVDFDAYGSGPAGATHSFEFDDAYTGFHITLTQATMHVGAVYLDAAPCSGNSEIVPCVDPDKVVVAQVNAGGADLDLLSPDPQSFTAQGNGILQAASTGEVWLAGGDINAQGDPTVVAAVAGTAEKDGKSYPFTGSVTISTTNRGVKGVQAAQPGLNPICKQRIVSPICLDPAVEPKVGTSLHVTVDPRSWFDNVDFSKLDMTSGPPYAIPDTNDDVTGRNFFQGIESASGVYSFAFTTP